MIEFSVIVLAGGRSSRMGSNKALVPYLGKPLISYAIDLACNFTRTIIISANTPDLDHLGFKVVHDELPVKAPIAGIHAGLKASLTDRSLVLTCDMPNVNSTLIHQLLAEMSDNYRLVLPSHDGFLEPLCGFYHKEMLPVIEQNVRNGKFSLLDLLDLVPHKLVPSRDEPVGNGISRLFRNVNEKKDLLS